MYSRELLAALAAQEARRSVDVELYDVASTALDADIPVSVLVPRGHDRHQPLPLLISLDGGVGDRMSLVHRQDLYTDMFATGVLPPMIVVSFSGGAEKFYHAGWENWITTELPLWARETFGTSVDADHLLMTGMSVGGYGTLKVGLKYPDRFKAIAAMMPVMLPALEWPEQHTRASWWMLESSAEAVWGSPFEAERFLADHPPNIAKANADKIAGSGLAIYLEVGDEDLLDLQDGAEFLHRVLWDQDIRHEFHQVRWADHGGPTVNDRLIEAHTFLASALAGGKSSSRDLPLTEVEQAFLDFLMTGGAARGASPPDYDLRAHPKREIAVMARMWQPLRDLASSNDPTMQRAYGQLPDVKSTSADARKD